MPKKPFEQLLDRQKKRIYKVCLELVAANGYNHTSVKMITRRLKVADGYLHYYFNGKEDLVRWTIDEGLGIWKEHFEKHVLDRSPSDLFDLFKRSILQMVLLTKEHPDLFACYVRLVNEPTFSLGAYLTEKIAWIDQLYVDYIRREMESGRVRSDLSPELVAMLLDVLNTRIQEFMWNPNLDPIGISNMNDAEFDAWLDTLISVVCEGVRCK